MLVDLGRNDLGKISKFGTVEVEKLRSIERYSHVMHIGSTVRGEIREDCDALDAVSAVLPAGTLSGAPKIRACQLIGELENNKRGIYGGAIGYIDFTGNLDVCIAIRIAYRKNGKVFIRSGAGIVADSVPENEYQECMLFDGIPERIKVARYHSLAANPKALPDCLKVTAITDDGEIMAVQHKDYPIFGVQFHPESIMTEYGRQMLLNFVKGDF